MHTLNNSEMGEISGGGVVSWACVGTLFAVGTGLIATGIIGVGSGGSGWLATAFIIGSSGAWIMAGCA